MRLLTAHRLEDIATHGTHASTHAVEKQQPRNSENAQSQGNSTGTRFLPSSRELMEDRTILLRMLASLLVASWSLRMRTDSGTGDRLAIEAPVTGKMRTFTRDFKLSTHVGSVSRTSQGSALTSTTSTASASWLSSTHHHPSTPPASYRVTRSPEGRDG